MPSAKTERGIIRRLKRQLAKHPGSKKLKKALSRHRGILRHLKPPLRQRAWVEMNGLIRSRVTEVGGNNVGPMVERIIRANGGVPGEPWCGDTVAYCYLRAGSKSVVRSWAAVRFLERLLTKVHSPRQGHVVIYSFDHTGLFSHWASRANGTFWAGEGNTGNAGAASDSITGGDGVKLKIRNVNQVSSFRRVLR